MGRGTLVLVVGPAGARKDTVIGEAQQRLAADERFFFPRRAVTRAVVVETEDHDTLTREQFQLKRHCGSFALAWEAHGLGYGIPAAGVEAAMMVGRVVIANVSRAVIGEARERYPGTQVVLITAPPQIRAARIAGRGRESEEEIAARLAREGAALPAGVFATIIDNAGPLEDGVRRFLKAITAIAS